MNNLTEVEEIKEQEIKPLKYSSVKQFGEFSEQNRRHRRKMEDSSIMIDQFRGNNEEGFFGIYDGHGGPMASQYASEVLHKHFEDALNKEKTVKDAFIYAYKVTDNELKQKGADSVGTTCVNAFVTKIDKERKLYVANAGDSRAVLYHESRSFRLSQDHKPSLKSEVDRIIEADGLLIQGRVNGIISLTRSLGDHNMKDWIINDPYYSEMTITPKDKFLILACDGIWDVLTDQEAVTLIKEEIDSKKAAEKIVKEALKKFSKDNLSCIVIFL
eukprot:gene4349-7705_t